MNFGEAIEALKQGKKVSRKGWNGKDAYIWMKQRFEIKKEWCKDPMLLDAFGDKDTIIGLPSLLMKTQQGEVVAWNASNSDVFAEDWIIIK